eukprot:NODE_1023_length_1755_cov_15.202814_g902_i0.p1 GENE.NODE_1023_length_1755_cov_15.202814_g902_i0~~NODE_1023_length_1755_cov_15.202814_g902_i0.p1  ORF type:complete len:338 (-),score=55.16 NODE_1023_length_1755_cov_15.202814_g902_i0:740-1684(-)
MARNHLEHVSLAARAPLAGAIVLVIILMFQILYGHVSENQVLSVLRDVAAQQQQQQQRPSSDAFNRALSSGLRELQEGLKDNSDRLKLVVQDRDDTRSHIEGHLRRIQHHLELLQGALHTTTPGELQEFLRSTPQQGHLVNPIPEGVSSSALPQPWALEGSRLFLAGQYICRLDGEGHIRFIDPTVERVQVHIGNLSAVAVTRVLASDPNVFLFVFGFPQEPFPRSTRLKLINAAVSHTAGYSRTSQRFPMVRLETFLQLVPPSIPVELLRIMSGNLVTLLSAGHCLTEVRRATLVLTDAQAALRSPTKLAILS